MKGPLKILLLEDCPDDATLIERELRKAGMDIQANVVAEKCDFESALRDYVPDVVLSDHSLPDFNSIEAFELFKIHRAATGTFIPFILVTGNNSEEFAVNSIKAGVDDYIQKNRLKRLPFAITSALEKCKAETQRLAYMELVKKSEQEFRSLFEENPDAVFSLDLLGRFTHVNECFVDLVAYTPEELVGTDFRKILIKSELEKVYTDFVCALERKPRRYETSFVNRCGKRFTLHVSLMAVVVDGQIIGTHCIAKDITEKRKFENLLEQAYRTARIGSWEFDLKTKKLSWTGVTREMHEVSDDYEPTIESAVAFYKEGRSRDMITLAIQSCIDNDACWDCELQIITGKGNERWVRAIGQGVREDGKCVRLYGTFQDIHDRKIAEAASRKAFEEKVNVLESIGDAFFAVDESWIVTYWNNRAEAILERPRKEVLGKNLWTVYRDAVPLQFYSQYQRAMKERITVHFEEYYPAMNLWFEVNVYPAVHGLSIYFRDITEQKAYLREIQNQNATLTEIARIQAHDVRAPLARLLGLVNLLDDRMDRDSELPRILGDIRKSAEELDILVRDIVSKSQAVKTVHDGGQ